MSLKHTIQLKKIKAVFLLLILFAVTVIQVSHSHPISSLPNQQDKNLVKKTGLPVYSASGAESKCFICEYQLSKDADPNFSIVTIHAPAQYQIADAAHYSFTLQHIDTFFETRGPPAVA